jgi:hypothetical protein
VLDYDVPSEDKDDDELGVTVRLGGLQCGVSALSNTGLLNMPCGPTAYFHIFMTHTPNVHNVSVSGYDSDIANWKFKWDTWAGIRR